MGSSIAHCCSYHCLDQMVRYLKEYITIQSSKFLLAIQECSYCMNACCNDWRLPESLGIWTDYWRITFFMFFMKKRLIFTLQGQTSLQWHECRLQVPVVQTSRRNVFNAHMWSCIWSQEGSMRMDSFQVWPYKLHGFRRNLISKTWSACCIYFMSQEHTGRQRSLQSCMPSALCLF